MSVFIKGFSFLSPAHRFLLSRIDSVISRAPRGDLPDDPEPDRIPTDDVSWQVVHASGTFLLIVVTPYLKGRHCMRLSRLYL